MFDLNYRTQAQLSNQRLEAMRAEASVRRLLKLARADATRPSPLARLFGKAEAPAKPVRA